MPTFGGCLRRNPKNKTMSFQDASKTPQEFLGPATAIEEQADRDLWYATCLEMVRDLWYATFTTHSTRPEVRDLPGDGTRPVIRDLAGLHFGRPVVRVLSNGARPVVRDQNRLRCTTCGTRPCLQ